MIAISVRVTKTGLLTRLEAGGHALQGIVGADPVCAAVSILLRTLGRLAELEKELDINSRAERPGDFFLDITRISPEVQERWKGVGSMALKGLSDLSRDYPEVIKLVITEHLEDSHGT